jgi:5-formyltetrahydrofolate cyclo-ligase
MLNNKKEIRDKMKILRKKNFALDESAAWSASKNFFHYLKPNYTDIGVYWPIQFELDTRPLIKVLSEKNYNIFLPAIQKNYIKFFKWQTSDPLEFNKLRFYEPQKISKAVNPELIIVPLLAFDNKGYRLGYGKGFYDKFYGKNKNILYVGFGYNFQKFPKLPSKHYDLKFDAIITDKYIINNFEK